MSTTTHTTEVSKSLEPDGYLSIGTLRQRFGPDGIEPGPADDTIPTFRVAPGKLREILCYLKHDIAAPYRMLYDLYAVDERCRPADQTGRTSSDFTTVYQLFSLERNADVRIEVPLQGTEPTLRTITDIWPAANWYEREAWDMLGIRFEGHPDLRRILMPPTWEGHPLRKDHPARATEMGPLDFSEEQWDREEKALRFDPQQWGLTRAGHDTEFLFLNVGPHHPGTHGVLRIVLQLDGEKILDAIPDIGFHHRGAEKMAERQTWHTYIPYTDRVDYLAGTNNNLPYLLAVEQLAGIEVPHRAQMIRVMICELFRIASHLVWYGTFAQDVGMMSPVFYMFTDRERLFDIIQSICGGRMHPNWFRIGGVAQDLPEGWDRLVREFVPYMRRRMRDYDRIVMKNEIFRARTVGVGSYTRDEAIEWGVTGPGLRATGMEWDFRKKTPYSGYEQFEFDIPTATKGDSFDRAVVRVEEIRQSLRIIEQCLENMPAGDYRSRHPLATPPLKDRTMHDIETLIHHFLSVSWGPVIPAGQASARVEAPKGANSYSVISTHDGHPYRVRIRTPSFAHIQMLPEITRGLMVPDLLAILGSIDYVLADVDR